MYVVSIVFDICELIKSSYIHNILVRHIEDAMMCLQ